MAWVDRIGQSSFCVHLTYDQTAARSARLLVARLLATTSASPEQIGDATLVAHELVVNGLTHGLPGEDGRIEFSAEVADGQLRVSVRDGGGAGAVAVRPLTADLPGGRGLAMVEGLCSRWSVDRSRGTQVSAWLPQW